MPSMRLFRKRKSVAPGQGDAKARETLAASARSPSPAAGAGAPPPPQAEEQSNLADTPAGVFEKLDSVSRDDVLFSSVPWAAAAATTEERPGSSAQPRVGDKAAAAAAQPPTFGRRHSQAKKDRLRLFRSRSTYFRRGPDDGSSKGGGGGEGGVASHKPRLSWPTPRGTTPTTTRSSAEPQAREQRQRSSRGQPGFESVEEGVSAGAAEEDGPVQRQQQQSPPPRQRSEETRRNSVIGAPATSGDSSSSSSWRLQSLKRLPSLSLKRRLSRSHRLKPPSVVVTPASVVSNSSPPSSAPGSASLGPRTSTLPPANPNKPLPPPPPPQGHPSDTTEHSTGTTDAGSRAGANLRLQRIMATLSDLDIEKLFSGAPQYFARSEGHFTGAPHPSVAFPWDEELAIRDLTDHVQIEDEAWGCITAWPHITRDVRRGPSASATKKVNEKRRAHFYPRCRERPNMLSMQGLEKGTMGYQAALELGVADALQEEQWGFSSLGAKEGVIIEARKALIASKDGLRRLEETTVMDHLIKNAQKYQEKHAKDKASCHELYRELFSQILHPPSRTFTDPFSLTVQIHALLKVLAAPNVWIDFSHVEWRIRLGQILWGTAEENGEDSVSDRTSITDAEDTKELHEERYWLLLQILLSCELLVRLDTITENDEIPETIKPSEILRFERDANPSVKWSLHLARAWLENIEISKTKPSVGNEEDQPKGWLANLTQRMTISSDRPHSRHHDARKQHFVYVMKGKYWERQVRGLTHFARRLKWPDIETQSTLISDNCRAVTEGTPINTPLESPTSYMTARSKDSSYFTVRNDGNADKKPPRRQQVGAALHPSGWLSKSYVSGLMLPGEGLYHFIMSTLLENDLAAMEKLGPMANLCGGFVYSGKSFWSTACVVGRVLAAGKGAVECMGWISSDIVPHNLNDGWVNIDVEDIPEDVKHTGKQARIWGKLAIERESSVLGGADPDSVYPADFIIPYENHYRTPPPTISVELKSLHLSVPLDSVQTTPTLEVATPFSDYTVPEMKTYTPAITFNVTTWEDDEDREYTIPVVKDVYFVTAHPCVPSQHVRILKSPSSPTIQQVDLTGHPVSAGGAPGHAKIACHPLHKYYTYTPIHLSELLAKPDWTLEEFLNGDSCDTAPSITPSAKGAKTIRVLVIDAITNFVSLPEAHDIPLSPVTSRASTTLSESNSVGSRHSSVSGGDMAYATSPTGSSSTTNHQQQQQPNGKGGLAEQQMHSETRRRQFGSDMEILVRALCAERGWNALISRRRRGCLACAIREAGALGWEVVIRLE